MSVTKPLLALILPAPCGSKSGHPTTTDTTHAHWHKAARVRGMTKHQWGFMLSRLQDPTYVTALRSNTGPQKIADTYGISRHAVRRDRKKLGISTATKADDAMPAGESETHNADGSSSYVRFSEKPWGYDDYREFIRSTGQNPDEVTFVWGWTSHPSGKGFWNKLNNVRPKHGTHAIDTASIEQRVKNYRPAVTRKTNSAPKSLIIVATDFQLGKTDWNGGTDDTLQQVLDSFTRAAELAVTEKPQEIVIVDAGDIIENIYSTSSQLGTNDRDLPHQVEAAMHVMLTGIQMLAPLAPAMKYVAVSSNHGAHRIGPKSPAGDVHADYGLIVAKMLGRALQLNADAYGHVEVITPEPYMESLAFETSGSNIGVVHGHQAGSADKLGEWWKGQSHGRMPTADARILIAGHWHSLRVQQSGDARWILVGPASDRGSSWFTNARGESSQSGMLTFLTSNNEWEQLRIV